VLTEDPAHGRSTTEVDWSDTNTHVRAIDRSDENIVGLIYQDRATGERMAAYRAGQKDTQGAIDPTIAAVTRAARRSIRMPPPPMPTRARRMRRRRWWSRCIVRTAEKEVAACGWARDRQDARLGAKRLACAPSKRHRYVKTRGDHHPHEGATA